MLASLALRLPFTTMGNAPYLKVADLHQRASVPPTALMDFKAQLPRTLCL